MKRDKQYQQSNYHFCEREHRYGNRVHLIDNPYLLTLAAQLSSPETIQPRFNEIIKEMYQVLFGMVASRFLQRRPVDVTTRLIEFNPEGVFSGEVIAREQPLVVVDLARAGILPSAEALAFFSKILNPSQVRVDHIFIGRAVDDKERVTGAAVAGSKIGGSVDGAILLIPDPMAATGYSIVEALDLYKQQVPGVPCKTIIVHLITAPEALARVTKACPQAEILTVRLDRGLSSASVLETQPGTHWQQERGLNDKQYIVPGAGGVGELMNNSFV